MKSGICKLCLENKELCNESHIIPRFMYKFLSGDNNKIVYLDVNRSYIRFNSEYEANILCKKCDTEVIGKLDTYAARIMHLNLSSGTSRTENVGGRDLITREDDPDYDYRRFKLFLLSVLWRSSISSRPFFKQLKLPEQTEEDLRNRILSSEPGEPYEYPCFITLPPLITMPDGQQGFHVYYMPTISPIYLTIGQLGMCDFIIQGVRYYYVISKPSNMKVDPSVGRNKLTMGEEYQQLQSDIARGK